MNRWTAAGVWVVACLLVPAVRAGNIYTCKGANGVNTYQNLPCAKPAEQIQHATYDDALARPGTPAPTAPRDRYGTAAPAHRGMGAAIPPPAALPATTGGLGSSAYQRGEVQGTRCVNARGQVYYTAAGCGTSTQRVGTQERLWRGDTVEGVPGAVMIGPDQAVDPRTGQVVELEHTQDRVDVYRTTRDAGAAMDADQACTGAQQVAAQHPHSQQAQRRVEDLCRRGRSLYDTQPSANSLYGSGH